MKTSVGRNKFFWPREQGRGKMEQELAYLVLTRERQGRGSVNSGIMTLKRNMEKTSNHMQLTGIHVNGIKVR